MQKRISISNLCFTLLTDPPAPLVAEPVRSVAMPLLPFDVQPDVSDSWPDTPAGPALAVRTLNTPLDVWLPYPVNKDTAPPVV